MVIRSLRLSGLGSRFSSSGKNPENDQQLNDLSSALNGTLTARDGQEVYQKGLI